MICKLSVLLAVLLAAALLKVSLGDVTDCKATVGGKAYDLSALKKGDYTWGQSILDTEDNLMTNPAYSDLINVTFQLGICQNVDSPSSGCTGPSPIFMIRQDNKKCFSLGSLDVATFEQNPFQDDNVSIRDNNYDDPNTRLTLED